MLGGISHSGAVETVPDHNYSRPWTDDPTIATALPRVQLFFNSNSTSELNVDVDENVEKINWPPTMNTSIPETFEFSQEWKEELTSEQNHFLAEIRELIDETRIAALCCELVCSGKLEST